MMVMGEDPECILPPMGADSWRTEAALARMLLIRAFEERLLSLFSEGRLMGTTHTCLGQEANAVGVAAALDPDDTVVSNHRGHGHFLAHVGRLDALMAEIMGKASGVCGGWGGSQHLCQPGRFYGNGIQGGILPLAAGLAWGHQLDGQGRVAVVFLGDGTLGQGVVYETMNLASCWKLPLLMVVEDNGIAQSTPSRLTLAGSVAERAAAFGIPWQKLSYPAAEAVHAASRALLQGVRAGRGPALLWIESARLGPHSKGDDTRGGEELAALRDKDPLPPMLAAVAGAEALQKEAYALVAQAESRALAAPWPQWEPPAPSLAVPPGPPLADDPRTAERLALVSGKGLRKRLNMALHGVMAATPRALFLGEDVCDPYGGAFKVSEGLSTAHPGRVMSTPISEAALVGMAGGVALAGYRPLVEVMFGDFLGLAMDQLVNHLSLYRAMYNGQVTVPVVIRTPMGGRRGYGPTHSQTLDKHFLGMPGLQVLAPSFLHPVEDMLLAAMAGDGPTLWIENKLDYGRQVTLDAQGLVEDLFPWYGGGEEAPWVVLSPTAFAEDGATLIVYGGMAALAAAAARELLLRDEVSLRVLIPSRLHPLDGSALLALLAPHGPLVVAEEGSSPFGFAAECAALLASARGFPGRGFARLGMAGGAVAASSALEGKILPQIDDILSALRSLLIP